MKTLTTTEITISLQTIVLVISVVVSATLYVNHIEEQLDVSAVLMREKGAKWDQDSEVLRENARKIRELELTIVRQQKDIEFLKNESGNSDQQYVVPSTMRMRIGCLKQEHDTKQVGSWYRQSEALETMRVNSYKDRLSLAKVKEGVCGTR